MKMPKIDDDVWQYFSETSSIKKAVRRFRPTAGNCCLQLPSIEDATLVLGVTQLGPWVGLQILRTYTCTGCTLNFIRTNVRKPYLCRFWPVYNEYITRIYKDFTKI